MIFNRLQTWLAFALIWLPITAKAQTNMAFEPEFAGYSWTMIAAPSGAGVVDMDFLPNGNLVIAQKHGTVLVTTASGTSPFVMLDIRNAVSSYGDGGLTAILLDPDLTANPYLYVFYSVETDTGNPDTKPERFGRISRFTLNAPNYEVANPASEQILLGATWPEGVLLDGVFHTNDDMAWGDDGSLLFSAGDASSVFHYEPTNSDSFAPGRFDSSLDIGSLRAQSLQCYNGKVGRIDRHTGLGLPSNPFYTGDPNDVQSRIWVYGLRNPWRFSVLRGTGSHDPADGQPGALWIGDVGLNWYEELDITSRTGGENFGWPFHEGPESDNWPFSQSVYAGPIPWPDPETIAPFAAALSHIDSTTRDSVPAELVGDFEANSITGGLFYDYRTFDYDGEGTPPSGPYTSILDGKYLFADWNDSLNGSMWLASLDEFENLTNVALMAKGGMNGAAGIVDLAFHPQSGAIYALTYWRVFRLDFSPTSAPPYAVITADTAGGPLPLTVDFDASDSSNPAGGAMTYAWDMDDGTTATTLVPYFTHTFTNNINHTVSVTVTNAASLSSSAQITIYAGNIPPVATINWPRPGTKYAADGTPTTIPIEGEASDPDGVTPPTFKWRLALRHNDHRHDILELAQLSGEVEVTAAEENTFYLLEFFVTDERGQTAVSSVEMYKEGEGPAPSSVEDAWQLYP